MNNRKLKEAGLLTQKQLKFVNAWSGNARIAARDAGYKNPESSADQLTSDPVVLAALKRKQDAMVEESGRRLGAQINVCRADIINHLWELARVSAKDTNGTIYGQVRATQVLADIMCMKVVRALDIPKELEGKTREDVDYFLIHGVFPESCDSQSSPAGGSENVDV